jgi:hypothetical protein
MCFRINQQAVIIVEEITEFDARKVKSPMDIWNDLGILIQVTEMHQ